MDDILALAEDEYFPALGYALYYPSDYTDPDYGKLYQKNLIDPNNADSGYEMTEIIRFIGPMGEQGDPGPTGRSGELTLYGVDIPTSDIISMFFKVLKRKEVEM